jgi:hypothetical protein
MIEKINKKSLAGLFDVNFQNKEPEDFFDEEYKPNRNNVAFLINSPKKEIEVNPGGAYSVYNWELFFHAPLTIAVHLSKNQRFAEAQKWFHYIFDPTSNDHSKAPPMRFWKFRTFRKQSAVRMIDELLTALSQPGDSELKKDVADAIKKWQNNPFQPHVVARNRFQAYQFQVVMKYLDNLIAWGDSLFRQDTMETINEATQLYVLAANILGPKPQEIPRREKVQPRTYAMLKKKLDAFGNAMVDMEVKFPFNQRHSGTETKGTDSTKSLYGITRSLYFCIPPNDKLLGYWDLVADRLFKIRHCMNIEGVVRQLPLFEPPIDPGMLVKAAAGGIDISSLVSGLNQPLSPVRASLMIQKALEICSEIKTMGNALLSALEKKDAEELSLLRQGNEIKILHMVEDVKYLQWKEAEAATESLLKTRETVFQRYRHYQRLLGKNEEDLNEIKDLSIERAKLDQDNFNEVYSELVLKYSPSTGLEEYGQSRVVADSSNLHLNSNENAELNIYMPRAHDMQVASSIADLIGTYLSLIPQFDANGQPAGMGASVSFGGQQLSTYAAYVAKGIKLGADNLNYKAARASKLASYQRRSEDWILQNNLAASELMQIGKQVIASLIREQIAKKEFENHKEQIRQAREIDDFLKDKFTNKDLYTWMQGEISRLYYESYKFAFDIAKKAEQTMKHELMRQELDDRDFIKFNYWDSGRKGLLSGETLFLDLKRMEMAYHEHNLREYELTKHISLQRLNPNALLHLKATGTCEIAIPEWLFDLDCPGHYMRRIKTVSVSIPCVTGPHTSINCTLSLQKSTIRKSTLMEGEEYGRKPDEDKRFIDYFGTIQSIVTSSAQNDSGLFEINMRDERYLPFEGSGAISTWKLELPPDLRLFNYDTITDVILHMRYTARQGGDTLKNGAMESLKGKIGGIDEAVLVQLFSLKHDFPTEWHQFVNAEPPVNFRAVIKKERFPYLVQGTDTSLTFNKIELITIEQGVTKSIVPEGIADDLNAGINGTDQQSEISMPSDDEVLKRDKEANVFMVLYYSKSNHPSDSR